MSFDFISIKSIKLFGIERPMVSWSTEKFVPVRRSNLEPFGFAVNRSFGQVSFMVFVFCKNDEDYTLINYPFLNFLPQCFKIRHFSF